MVRVGAQGQTAAQMDAVLHSKGLSPTHHAALTNSLEPRKLEVMAGAGQGMQPAYLLDIANALWGQRDFQFEKPFLDTLEQTFHAPLAPVDFQQPKRVRQLINSWVAKNTQNKIEDLVPPGLPDPDTRLVLANAIYCQSSWAIPFGQTKPDPSTRAVPRRPPIRVLHPAPDNRLHPVCRSSG